MISKDSVVKYLSEGLFSNENWFNFKEDDNDNKSNNKTEKPNLNWTFYKDGMILYSGSSSSPDSQYYPFADEIRYAEFNKNKNNNDSDDNENKNNNILKPDFKKKLRNFGLALASGGLAVAADTMDKVINTKIDKNKKDKNGASDKWVDYVITSFNSLNDFKDHAQKNHVPSNLIDTFIKEYESKKSKIL